jgi:hypothetical protein
MRPRANSSQSFENGRFFGHSHGAFREHDGKEAQADFAFFQLELSDSNGMN